MLSPNKDIRPKYPDCVLRRDKRGKCLLPNKEMRGD